MRLFNEGITPGGAKFENMSTSTIIALGLFFGIAIVPKVPWYIKVVAQIIVGAVIYLGFTETMFDLPMGDKLPISALFGGSPEWEGGGFKPLTMGVLGTVLGLLATGLATALYAVIGKTSDGD